MHSNHFKNIFLASLIITTLPLHSATTPADKTFSAKQIIHHFFKDGGAAALGAAGMTAIVLMRVWDKYYWPAFKPSRLSRFEYMQFDNVLYPRQIYQRMFYIGIASFISHKAYKYITRRYKKKKSSAETEQIVQNEPINTSDIQPMPHT